MFNTAVDLYIKQTMTAAEGGGGDYRVEIIPSPTQKISGL